MYTKEYKNYKRMTKMTVRFLENYDNNSKVNVLSKKLDTFARTSIPSTECESEKTITTRTVKPIETKEKAQVNSTLVNAKKESTLTAGDPNVTNIEHLTKSEYNEQQQSEHGQYTNWTSKHTTLTALPWCCVGDLMAFCDKYEYRSLNRNDPQTHNRIVTEIKALLNSQAPFDIRKRFPGDIRSPENLWVCIGRCAGVEYHLNRILSIFRKPMDKLAADKQRMVRHDFHLAVSELRLDISARISEVRLYDRNIFEREFNLEWKNE